MLKYFDTNLNLVIIELFIYLISGRKFEDSGYTAVYDQKEVNFYDSNKIKITAKSVLQGYRCPRTGLWIFPLQDHIQNENTDTIILNAKQGKNQSTYYMRSLYQQFYNNI